MENLSIKTAFLAFLPVLFFMSNVTNAQVKPADPVYDVVEEMPTPEGGIEAWNEYLMQNLSYPDAAKEKGIEGTVMLTFVVDEFGNLTDPQILRGIGAGCDEEALRLIKDADPWQPGKQKDKPVKVRFKQAILFKL